jgi:large-conductance mechanosensitive channel
MLKNFIKFLDEKDIIGTAVGLVLGTLIKDIIKKISGDIITPLARGDIKQIIKQVKFKEYLEVIINFIMTSFILYLMLKLT